MISTPSFFRTPTHELFFTHGFLIFLVCTHGFRAPVITYSSVFCAPFRLYSRVFLESINLYASIFFYAPVTSYSSIFRESISLYTSVFFYAPVVSYSSSFENPSACTHLFSSVHPSSRTRNFWRIHQLVHISFLLCTRHLVLINFSRIHQLVHISFLLCTNHFVLSSFLRILRSYASVFFFRASVTSYS